MTLQLRAAQQDSIDGLRQGFIERHQAQMLYGPCGFGKTECAMSLLVAANAKGSRSAMVLDRIVLVNQTSERLDKYKIPHGVLQAGHWRYRPHERIQICSAQTLEARGSFPGLDLLIVDEAHQTRKATAEFIKANPSIRVVGLSGSPFTNGLGAIYTNLVARTTIDELTRDGFLAPLRVFQAKQIDMTGAKKVAGEWTDKDAGERGIKITGDVVREWAKKTHELFGKPEKTIVFCAGVDHGADLAREFAEAGYNFVSISYKDDEDFKKDAIAEFSKDNSTIHGLIATDILTKGFDNAGVMIGVSARPFSKSFSSHVQQLGRVMRPAPGKSIGVWLCHSGNYMRFQQRWEGLSANGPGAMHDGAEKAQPEPTERDKEIATCPQCHAVFPGYADVCAHCGYARLRRNGVVVLPGELQELVRAERAEQAQKQQFYSELLSYAQEMGFKPGWADFKFEAKFKVRPFGLNQRRAPVSAATERWAKSQYVRYIKGKQKSQAVAA